MYQPGKHTLQEIDSQPEAWAAVIDQIQKEAPSLERFLNKGNYEAVLFVGCGSTYYLSLAAAALYQGLVHIPARGQPSSEVWLSDGSAYLRDKRTLLVAVSRSGETSETIQACEVFKSGSSGDVITLSCYPDMPLTQAGEVNLVFPSGQEVSIAQTRAFSSLYLASMALALVWKGDKRGLEELEKLPEYGSNLLENYRSLAKEYGSNRSIETVYFLGSGSRYGLACELSLKMKEISLSVSEPFYFLEFRHGPMSMVTEKTLIVGLVSDTNRVRENAVLEEMRNRGAAILTMGNQDANVWFDAGISEPLRNPLFLPIGQLLAVERAFLFGLDPDKPRNLNAVVKLPT